MQGYIFSIWAGVLVLLASCSSSYHDHFVAEHRVTSQEIALPDFSGGTLLVLPDQWVKSRILESIREARERIWIEIYLWTDKDILEAVIHARDRWVDVRVILEGNVYALPQANTDIYRRLLEANILVTYADGYRYTFTHAKFWIIDGEYFVSTGNLTKSFFETNRDMIVTWRDPRIYTFLLELFQRDFAHESLNEDVPSQVTLSPSASREKLLSLLRSAENQIDVFVQTVSDKEILALLQKKQGAGVRVRICTALNESNTDAASWAQLDWKQVKKPYLHAKMLLIDGHKIWIGSQNFTRTSLDENREVGILFTDSGSVFSSLAQIVKKDCQFE